MTELPFMLCHLVLCQHTCHWAGKKIEKKILVYPKLVQTCVNVDLLISESILETLLHS